MVSGPRTDFKRGLPSLAFRSIFGGKLGRGRSLNFKTRYIVASGSVIFEVAVPRLAAELPCVQKEIEKADVNKQLLEKLKQFTW